MKNQRQAILVILAGALLASCSNSTPGLPEQELLKRDMSQFSSEELSIDLFAARGSLFGSSFERYIVKDSILWKECGAVSRNKSNAPKLTIEQRRVEEITPLQRGALQRLKHRLQETTLAHPQKNPLPGGLFAVSSPGILELRSEATHVLSSVDATSDGQTPQLKVVRKIFEALRGVGSTICDSPTFYGIGKRSFTSDNREDGVKL
jgi:hypothetical protein